MATNDAIHDRAAFRLSRVSLYRVVEQERQNGRSKRRDNVSRIQILIPGVSGSIRRVVRQEVVCRSDRGRQLLVGHRVRFHGRRFWAHSDSGNL